MNKPTPLHSDQNPDVIFVFRIRPTDEDPSTNVDYENQVISAVSTDLQKRLGVPTESIELFSAGYREVPLVSPCGDTTIKEEEQPLGGGLAAGYEVVFQVENTNYRYTAVGGLAYFCGEG